MRLNRLKILGFKSFADEVELEFQPGLTAIVGPNGCGKSNISDAIRWVLGEQNARFLRGKEMGDVIFNGTASRKPLGLAEITLEMRNLGSLPLDFQHIVITRRLYRSGESEYILNKKTCRLKDITDLFLEWGMNKRAYTTVEQGNIDFIINAKPFERRILIETAAGILKYKERKREAIQKMELTKGNLDRIHDIKKEVENQRLSLQRHARRAKLYKAICQQTEEKERRCLNLRHKILKFHLDQSQSAYQKLLSQEQGALTQLRTQEAVLEESRLKSLQLTTDFERFQKTLWEQEAEKRHMEKGLDALIQEKELREETLKRLILEKETLELKHDKSQKRLKDLDLQLDQLKTQILLHEKKQKEIDGEKARSEKQMQGIQDQLERKKKDLTSFNTKISLIQNNISHLKAKIGDIDRKISETAKTERDILKENERIECEISETQRKKKALLSKRNIIENSLKTQESSCGDLSKKLQESTAQIDKQRAIAASLRHRKEHLEDLDQKMEGFRSAVKYLLKDTSGRKTIAQILGTQKEYEHALGAILGEDLQDILIESKEEAITMIHALRNQQKGKATFMPLSIQNKSAHGEVDIHIKEHPGFLGRMIDFISFPKGYHDLFDWLLGDFLLVRDFESGLEIERNLNDPWHLVTLEGDIIRSEGIFIGGGIESDTEGILVRKRELKELLESLEQEDTAIKARLEEQGHLNKDLNQMNQELRAMRDELSKVDHSCKDLDRDLQYLTKEKDAVENQKRRILRDRAELQKEFIKIQKSVSQEEEKEKGLMSHLQNVKEEIQGLEGKWEIAFKVQSAVNQTFMEEGMGLAALKERTLALEREKKGSEYSNQERERDFARMQEDMDGMQRRVHEVERESVQLSEKIPVWNNKVMESQERLENIRTLLNQAKEKGMEDEENLRKRRYELEQIRKTLKSREIDLAEWRTRMDDLRQDFSFAPGEESVSGEDVLPYESELEDLKRQLERLRERIQNFGSVNLAAIEEFQEVDERYQFLLRQTTDLQNALDSVMSIIKEINTTSRELFQEAFHQVNQSFHQIFIRLFEGGQAGLHLEEGKDCLEAGIHIVAQPPGKRLQRIDLLSGGEKALTAIALILAVYQLKPSPFCILDEVDAPLDEANVDRFLKLIDEMKERTQFIIITHCKRTMMNVDSIYGITMEKPGVSKVVSVKIDQADSFYSTHMPGKKRYMEAVQ